MQLNEFLSPERSKSKASCSSKKRCLEVIARLAAGNSLEQQDPIFSALFERERLGSTSVGNGVAIPHCRLAGISEIKAVLITLDTPIDFDAADNLPVDIIMAIIAPSEDNEQHLLALQAIATKLSSDDFLTKLRAQTSDQALFNTAIST